jgi:hypothetical protein
VKDLLIFAALGVAGWFVYENFFASTATTATTSSPPPAPATATATPAIPPTLTQPGYVPAPGASTALPPYFSETGQGVPTNYVPVGSVPVSIRYQPVYGIPYSQVIQSGPLKGVVAM